MTSVKTHKLLQICKQVGNEVGVKPISGCVRTACSQLLWQVWNKLLTPCNKVDDGNRLATSCSNKTNTGCSYYKLQYELTVVITLLRADDIRLVGTTCCESVGLINLNVTNDNNLFQTCQQLGTSSANTSSMTSCEIFTRAQQWYLWTRKWNHISQFYLYTRLQTTYIENN
jgi:hypothetical protein